jgi:hypothetical protein
VDVAAFSNITVEAVVADAVAAVAAKKRYDLI